MRMSDLLFDFCLLMVLIRFFYLKVISYMKKILLSLTLMVCFFASSIEAEIIEIKIAAKDVPENHFDFHSFDPDDCHIGFANISLVVPSFEIWVRRELNLQVYDKIRGTYTERELSRIVDPKTGNIVIINSIKSISVFIDIETID